MDRMSSDSEEVKRLAELKARLHRKLEALREEAETIESLLSIIDSILVTKSFKTAEVPQPTTAPTVEAKPEQFMGQIFQLKASDGTLLARMYATDEEVRVLVEPDLNLYLSTPPFQSFLVNRILRAMEAKDRELVSSGQISPEKAFSFDIKVEGDVVKEIYIRNYRDRRRLRELRTSIRWTLEKMYEKQRI